MYQLELAYFILPLLSLFLVMLGIGNRKSIKILLTVLFVAIYSLSLNGSDFVGYNSLYDLAEKGASLGEIHGEPGYYYLMQFALSMGLNYITFRALLLSLTSLLLFYSIAKLSENFALSVFFVSTMFIVYTISAYRQYMVIAGSVFLIYQYGRGRRKTAVLGLILLLFFHVTAILPLACVAYHHIFKGQKTEKQIRFIKSNYIKLIGLSLLIRVAATGMLTAGPIRGVIIAILAGHASSSPTLVSFGLVSRLFFMVFVSYLYFRAKDVKPTTKLIFWYYFVSLLIYVMVPLEFAMGRLMNNASILLAVLIPVLRYDQDKVGERPGWLRIRSVSTVILVTELVALIVLTNQMLHQDGYTPYLNILRADKSVVFTEEDEEDEEEQEVLESNSEELDEGESTK